jgi:hypothetical protein
LGLAAKPLPEALLRRKERLVRQFPLLCYAQRPHPDFIRRSTGGKIIYSYDLILEGPSKEPLPLYIYGYLATWLYISDPNRSIVLKQEDFATFAAQWKPSIDHL